MWKYRYTTPRNELYHHGVKGMKWGVRRAKKQLVTNLQTKSRSNRIYGGVINE